MENSFRLKAKPTGDTEVELAMMSKSRNLIASTAIEVTKAISQTGLTYRESLVILRLAEEELKECVIAYVEPEEQQKIEISGVINQSEEEQTVEKACRKLCEVLKSKGVIKEAVQESQPQEQPIHKIFPDNIEIFNKVKELSKAKNLTNEDLLFLAESLKKIEPVHINNLRKQNGLEPIVCETANTTLIKVGDS